MQTLNGISVPTALSSLAQHVVGCTEFHFSSHHLQMAAASFFASLQSSTCELHFCRCLCPAPKPICRRRSQTPRLLCSACSLLTVALFGRLWNGFEVCTHNLQGSSQSKQRAVEFTVHRQVRTHGHKHKQTHELCQPAGSQTASVHYKPSQVVQ